MTIIRVKPDVSSAVYDDESDSFVTLAAGMEFDDSDPIVAKFPWAFESDSQTTRTGRKRVTAVETTSAEPGSKRNR